MPSGTAILVQTNYDRSILASDAGRECCYCLTLGQVRAIQGMIEQWTWPTRWWSPDDQDISPSELQNFAGDLYRRLILGCGETTLTMRRVNPDTGIMEVSIDGGVTWSPDPADPRTSAVVLPPPVPDTSPDKCGAALSIQIGFASMITQLIAQKEATASDAEQAALIAATLTGIFGTPVGAAITLIFGAVVSWLISADAAAMSAAFTEITFDQLRCALYCTIGTDGNYDDSSFAELLAKVSSDVSDSYAKTAIVGIFTGLKPVGLNNWAAQRYGAGADCSDCECFDTCDPEFWTVIDGTDVVYGTDGDGDYVELTSVTDIPNTGAQGILLTTGNADLCCKIMAYDVISGHLGGGLSSMCGTPAYPDSGSLAHTGIPVPPDTANSILFYDLAVFRLRIHFGAP